MNFLGLLLILVFLSITVAVGKQELPTLTKIKPNCDILGVNWKESEGIKIDNLSDLSRLSPQKTSTVEKLKKQIEPLGIIALADYSCAKTKEAINIVTIKVFVFENDDRALSWWNKKYKYDGWEQHYTIAKNLNYSGVDSKQLKKRAILLDNLWITAHHIQQGDEHLVLLENIIGELKR